MSAPLELALLTQGWSPDPGGVETHTAALARGLRARGHRVRALCLDPHSARPPFELRSADEPGAAEVSVTRMAYRYHDHRALADLVDRPAAEEVVLAWLARRRCDVLHVHHLTGWGTGVLKRVRSAFPEVRLVVSLHDYWTLCPRGQMYDHRDEPVPTPSASGCGACLAATWAHLMPSGSGVPRLPGDHRVQAEPGAGARSPDDADCAAARTAFALECLEEAHALLVPSAAAAAPFVRAGVPAERLRELEYGIDAEGLARAVARERARRPRGPRPFVLGQLGSLIPSKGPLELARAVLAVDADVRLELHGPAPSWHGRDDYAEALRGLAREQARIALMGAYASAELPRVLAGLDAVAVPSRWEETYGLVAREARAAGLPVLVSDRGGLPAAVAGCPRSRVLPADDPEAWARAIETLAGERSAAPGAERGPGLETPDAPRTAWRSLDAMLLELEGVYRAPVRGARRTAPVPGRLGRPT